MAHMVKHLLSKDKALNSNCTIAKKEIKLRKKIKNKYCQGSGKIGLLVYC
jgi:hypothetical protein